MNCFVDQLKTTMNGEKSITENGAVGYRTTGNKLLNINFAISSLRKANKDQIETKYSAAFYEDPLLAVKWLFYAGDVREGAGERRLFRVGTKWLTQTRPEIVRPLLPLVAEYTRWDNLWCLLGTELHWDIIDLVEKQLEYDLKLKAEGKPISLLAKWMPSENATSQKTKEYAKMLIKDLKISERDYRKIMTELRAYLRVVETMMSAKKWNEIDYSAVPSRANLIYNSAFLRNDEERRRAYLAKLVKGETKINAGVLFPHDIVNKYTNGGHYINGIKTADIAIEEMWKALPDYVKGNESTICVADGSGSMTTRVSGNISALDVANALAIYFAERCQAQFKDKYITFSEHPQLVDFSNAKTLREKVEIALRHNEVANTNIEAVFDLILQTAIDGNMSQEEIPKNILILSDMEFDSCAIGGVENVRKNSWGWSYSSYKKPDTTLFDTIAAKYTAHGYKLPRLVFWNITSRTGTIPVKENDLGVALVSGFSPAVVKMVVSNATDPFECLLEQINSERYAPVEEAIKQVV